VRADPGVIVANERGLARIGGHEDPISALKGRLRMNRKVEYKIRTLNGEG
jgi:hypothetical protein